MAVALTALDAVIEVQSSEDSREIAIGDFYRLPEDEPQRDTTLEHGELITGVILPELPMARVSTYHKIRDRSSYAFALVSLAAALQVTDGIIEDVRIAFGGLAHKPWRALHAEQSLRGAAPTDAAFDQAAEAELTDATPLADNGFKVTMARRALVAVLRELTAQQSA
jgi:xanthine dehydrogenase YagS FAD-binding subunit